MSCPIHDRCTCCSASLQYTASITTAGTSQFAPQSSNLLFGYEWAPLVASPGGPWHAVDPVAFHPSSMSCSGQDLSQPDYYRPRNTYEAMPLHHAYNRESRPHVHEQKQALPSREQPSYPSPYIQGVGRMAIPNSFSGSALPALHLHRVGPPGFASHEELSQAELAIDSDQGSFDEPPPPYTNNSLLVHPLSGVYPPSAVLSTDRFLNVGPMTSSPLAPVPLRHSSLYQVLKHESPASPSIGTLHSRVSSLAHALEPQDPQARQAPLPCTPALGDRLGSYGISAPSPNAAQMTSTSLSLVAGDPCSTLVRVPLAAPAPAQTQRLASSEAPLTTCAIVPPQNLSIVTPQHAHTLAHGIPEVATHDYDTLPRLRKLQPALPGSGKEDHSAASSPLSSLSSRPSSSTGAPESSTNDSKSALESAFTTLPQLGRKRPVLRAKLACLFCRRRKIQCRPLLGDRQDNSCQQCAKRGRQCEYPEVTWRGRGRKRSHGDDLDESDYEEDLPPLTKIQRQT
ncbi:hypothetical protein EDB86DRAFT_959103 [Lactarius hatsudake]|nr:hypothetical protein EDB86DRAFT_959103 [Lactarius hatsudake]